MKKWLICLLLSVSFSSNVSADISDLADKNLADKILSSGKLLFSDGDESIFIYRNNYYRCDYAIYSRNDIGLICTKLTTGYLID